MKTQHTLENGTVLKVGEKYLYRSEIITITALGDYQFLFLDSVGDEDILGYNYSDDIEPYQEPKQKDLEILQPIVVVYRINSEYIEEATIIWRKKIPESIGKFEYLTIEEAKQRGLNINF